VNLSTFARVAMRRHWPRSRVRDDVGAVIWCQLKPSAGMTGILADRIELNDVGALEKSRQAAGAIA